MKIQLALVLGAVGLLTFSCQNTAQEGDVISQRYIHKYGYAVSKEEWESRNYPGQVITNLRNGVTVMATYENGILHGPCTNTYPSSQTLESYCLYNQGNLVKEILYDVAGMPVQEKVRLSPTRYSLTFWYADGTPMSLEEFAHEELLEAQYLSDTNETQARVEKGNGLRIRRTRDGILLSKDQIQSGYMIKREAFYPDGTPESIAFYADGQLHGEKKTFAASVQNGKPGGEPLYIEEWIRGQLHGKSTYFKNGVRYLEISYLDGQKNGAEIHYLDDERIAKEILWEHDKKHGPTTYYFEDGAQIEYYYDGNLVSQSDFEELNRRDEMTAQISADIRWDGNTR